MPPESHAILVSKFVYHKNEINLLNSRSLDEYICVSFKTGSASRIACSF